MVWGVPAGTKNCLWYQSDEHVRSGFRGNCVPHLGFAAAPGGLFVNGSVGVVRMHLD